jgi:hypothetical protein
MTQTNLEIAGSARFFSSLLDAANSEQTQRFSGKIQAGTMIAYTQNYDSTNLTSSTFTFQSTASSTASITTATPNNLPPPPVP